MTTPLEKSVKRCPWPAANDPLYLKYHDEEWGVPVTDDRKIFEFLVLEAFQAGLSWQIILRKRENFRKAFASFEYNRVARFTARDVERLVSDAGIVRNRAKIEAAISNAKAFLEVRKEFGTFSTYMWSFVGGKPIRNRPKLMKDVPAVTDEAVFWAKDLKKRGFRFLGPTVVYAHMQAVGMVNDHIAGCFRSRQLAK
ncbi:MAG: DNA-3-methyladenine glycosylase I [Elusimicrobia bacterium]|nr:DNA-3-methyladenine glycosylase I [Elusimicrobiota bacterium]